MDRISTVLDTIIARLEALEKHQSQGLADTAEIQMELKNLQAHLSNTTEVCRVDATQPMHDILEITGCCPLLFKKEPPHA